MRCFICDRIINPDYDPTEVTDICPECYESWLVGSKMIDAITKLMDKAIEEVETCRK